MPENKLPATRNGFSIDWLVRGVLTKVGNILDNLTGRSWKPSSSVATSELVERLKILLDAEARDLGEKGRFVPHHIKLKTQWDKFSTDSETSLKKLEYELLTAAIDHINDRRYQTYAPLEMEIKPDYFTEGVKLSASFDKFADEESERELNVTFPDLKNVIVTPPEEPAVEPEKEFFVAQFKLNGEAKNVVLTFLDGQRKGVGRTKENDLWIDDPSVSKIHAALVLNSKGKLMVADTGSTNGTFVGGQRIPYGKAFLINSGEKLKFGSVEVLFQHFENNGNVETSVEEPETKEDFSTKEDNSSSEKVNSNAKQNNSSEESDLKTIGEKTISNFGENE